jgi:hypothetical protein
LQRYGFNTTMALTSAGFAKRRTSGPSAGAAKPGYGPNARPLKSCAKWKRRRGRATNILVYYRAISQPIPRRGWVTSASIFAMAEIGRYPAGRI